MYDEGFPWIKFTLITVPFIVLMLYMAPTMKWKILFSLCVPVGVGFALTGKSVNLHKKKGGGY